MLDADGCVLRSTGRATRRLRERRGPIVGKRIADAYADHPEVVQLVDRALGGEAFVATVTAAGRTFECAYLPVLGPDGAVQRVIGIAHDVTERARAQRRLDTLHRQLAEARLALVRHTRPVADRAHVLVVGGRSIARDGLAALLSAGNLRADAVASVHAALGVLQAESVDLCLLDGRGGLDRLRRLRDASPGGPVVVLVATASAAADALERGAAGAVRWDDPSEDVEEAVRAALDGEVYVSAALARELAQSLHTGLFPTPAVLSEREREVLALYGADLQRCHIAERLCLSPETISTYRKALLKKLALSSTAELVRYAKSHGFVAADSATERL